jgi:hypothetical protein
MGAILWPFLIYWVAMFVACSTVLEVGQYQLYDEVTPRSGLKVTAGSFVLAALLTWLRPSFDTMFTSDIAWTLLQAIVWSGVFILVFQFQPPHGALLGTLTMLVVSGLATMGVQSLTTPRPALPSIRSLSTPKAIRQPIGPRAVPKEAKP